MSVYLFAPTRADKKIGEGIQTVIELTCQGCGAKFRLSDDKGGRKRKCQKCGHLLIVPSATSIEKRKTDVALPAHCPPTSPTEATRPDYSLSYSKFVAELDLATRETLQVFYESKGNFSNRLRELIEAQVSSYTSTSEFRERVQRDVDAVIERELRAFIERFGRRCEIVEKSFRSWVDRMLESEYEIGLPHSMIEYLSRPGGLVLSVALFLVLESMAYLAMYMSPLPYFDKGPVPILAGILATFTAILISLWGGKAIYIRSAKQKGIHDRAVFMSQVGFDSFLVGAMPVSDALSGGERAGLAGAGAGFLALWLGVEPLTGVIATALAAFWGWATGGSLKSMQERAKENILTALEPRLEDFLDSFADKLLKFNDMRLQYMRQLYLAAFGPDDNPILQRQIVLRPKLEELVSQKGSSRPSKGTRQVSSHGDAVNDALLGTIREVIGGQAGSNLCVAPNIPQDKLTNATDSYAQGTQPEDVLFLYDDTFWGSAKTGFCFTRLCLFWRNIGEEAQRLEFSSIHSVYARKGKGFQISHLEVNGKRINAAEEKLDVLDRVMQAARDRLTA
jgi:DNA-directed RNA polymerase subunit RPC12/RpoP